METRDPETPEEWQTAVDAAHAAMLLWSAREEHGIVEGGPGVKVERCKDLLERGQALGYTPSEDDLDTYWLAFQFEDETMTTTHKYERIRAVDKMVGGRRLE